MPEPATGSESEATAKKPVSPSARVSFPVTPDDRIDLEKASDTSKERLRKMLNDPALRAELGAAPAPVSGDASAPRIAVDPALAGALYRTLGNVSTGLAIRMGYRPENASLALTFTPAEIAELTPETTAVSNKWLGKLGATKYPEETALLVKLGSILAGKVMILAALENGSLTPDQLRGMAQGSAQTM